MRPGRFRVVALVKKIGFLSFGQRLPGPLQTQAIFGRTYAAEPDTLIQQLKEDEAIAAADTLLLTVPNQLGVDYNAHVIDSILTHVAPALWRLHSAGGNPAGDQQEAAPRQGRWGCAGRRPAQAPAPAWAGDAMAGMLVAVSRRPRIQTTASRVSTSARAIMTSAAVQAPGPVMWCAMLKVAMAGPAPCVAAK